MLIMEAKLRAYLASVLFDLRMGKNLPILNCQFEQLTKALVSELHNNGHSIDKAMVENYLVTLFSFSITTDNNNIITEVLSEYDISSVVDSLMI